MVPLRVRISGKANVSRAVSELVKAGLLRRHYQGFRVDHRNRGAQRQVVYSLTTAAKAVLGNARVESTGLRSQADLFF
jgi:DNA-binding MarR family transcriptional regulator